MRNPSTLDVGPVIADNFQFRLGASLSPIDMWRGARLLSVSRADCAVHLAETAARKVTSAPMDALLVGAYRAQAASLAAAKQQREQLMEQASARLRNNIITVMEFHDLQRLVHTLRQKEEETDGIVARLHADGIEEPPATLSDLAQRYRTVSETYEDRAEALRALEPWTFRVMGGAIPTTNREADWYGWVELGFNFGGLARGRHERRYREARRAELETGEAEVPKRVSVIKAQVGLRVDQAKRELSMTDTQIEFTASMLRSLESAKLENVAHVRDSLLLQQMLAHSERAFLATLIDTLSPLRSN